MDVDESADVDVLDTNNRSHGSSSFELTSHTVFFGSALPPSGSWSTDQHSLPRRLPCNIASDKSHVMERTQRPHIASKNRSQRVDHIVPTPDSINVIHPVEEAHTKQGVDVRDRPTPVTNPGGLQAFT